MTEDTLIKKIYSAFFEPEFPLDLTLTVVWLAATIVTIYFPILNETLVRVVFALPVLLFIPGYCLVSALFPKKGDIDILERIVLSIGLSIAIVPLIGFCLNFTPWGIRLDPIVLSLVIFTFGLILIAYVRRTFLRYEDRFRIQFSEIEENIRRVIHQIGGTRMDRFFSIILTLGIIIAIITIAYLIAFPNEGEHFSEFFILGENQTAADYPNTIIVAENYPMYIGVVNHEFRSMNYTIEIWTIRSEFNNATNSSTIAEMDPNKRLFIKLSNNETRIIPFNLFVNKSKYNQVEFLLFSESVPESEVTGSDRINASYRALHLWVNT